MFIFYKKSDNTSNSKISYMYLDHVHWNPSHLASVSVLYLFEINASAEMMWEA